MTYKNGAFAPIFLNTLNYQLDKNLVGQLKYRTGVGFVNTAMSTGLVYDKDGLNLNATVQLSVKNSFVSFSIGRMFNNDDIRLKSSIQYGYFGATFSYGIEKQVTKFSRVDASIMVNSMAGVILNLELVRGMQHFMMPIQLSHEVVPSAIFYGTITPLICYHVVKKLVIDPYVKSKEEE
jgi:DnaJ family protein C protein 11